jgi:hypothetical protein
MGDGLGKAEDGWKARLRRRREDRRARRLDRRARRKAHVGNPDDAARQAESGTAGTGGFFTTKSRPKH